MTEASTRTSAGSGRIARNVAATYGRSLVALVCGLFSARWVLQALGASDYGLYAIVGSSIALAWYLGELLRISVVRHFAYAVGEGRGGEERAWFASAWAVHLVLAFVLAAVAWPVGEVLVRRVIVMPAGRLTACLGLLRLSVASLFVTVALLPFAALFTARQRFVELAVFGTVHSLFLLGCAAALRTWGGDRLVAYGVYMTLGSAGVQVLQALRALWVFPSCRVWPGRCAVREKVRRIVTFAGWNTFGGGGYIVSVHGSNFVTNRTFGAAANASYGVADSVRGHVEALANALVWSFEPAVIGRCGAGDRVGMCRLAARAGFWGTLLFALFMVPLSFEMETVLGLWLGTPPTGAVQVCRVLLAAILVDKLTMGQQLAIAADGRIAVWHCVGGLAFALALPLTAVLASTGCGLTAAAAAFFVVQTANGIVKVWQGHRVADMSPVRWLADTVLPLAVILSLACGAGALVCGALAPGLPRVAVTSVATTAVFAAGALWRFVSEQRTKTCLSPSRRMRI